ncbi:hypothetical protein ACUUL3_03465 [Thiovibrio sp. JS02]
MKAVSGFVLLWAGLALAAGSPAFAKEIRLKRGEVYREHDLAVICEGGPAAASGRALAVRECQYWDDFAKKCLFEKTSHTYNGLECTEECQHWDSFANRCDYQSRCVFYPREEAFVRSTCAEFDDYSRKCLKVREEKIEAGSPGSR